MTGLFRICLEFAFVGATMMAGVKHAGAASQSGPLKLDVFVGEANSYNVTSTLIYGKSESILFDCQFRISQATKLADRISATHTRLKAIIISHPDYDHYLGMAVLHERFPDTPIYMTAAALEEFKRTSPRYLAGNKKSNPEETPNSLPTPEVLPTTIFTVDGEAVDVVKDYQGDVLKTSNSFLWIPSLRAVIAGDVVFNGIYAWFGDSSVDSRRAWHESLRLIKALHPLVVVAGHKGSASLPDSPQAVTVMEKYLDDFDEARKTVSNAAELIAVMKKKYPTWRQDDLLEYSAQVAIPPTTKKASGSE